MDSGNFVWSERKYNSSEFVEEGLGWGIFNDGCLAMKAASDGEIYNFPPEAIDHLCFLKPSVGYKGAICLSVADDYKQFAIQKYGTDLIDLCGMFGWKDIKKYPKTVISFIALAQIFDDNGIRVIGDYDKFCKLLK